jgi:hypothetical protein
LALPQVSSERRNTIPVAFLQADTLCGDKLRVIEKTSLYHFGVLNSWMHMAWTRQVSGRLKSDFQYSALIVYNNYPWPGFAGEPLSDKHRTAIEQAAQGVLDARAQFPRLDTGRPVRPTDHAPGPAQGPPKTRRRRGRRLPEPSGGKKAYATDAERVAFLFELYQRITSLLPGAAAKKTRKTKVTES